MQRDYGVVASQPLHTPFMLTLLSTDAPWRWGRCDGARCLWWKALAAHPIDGSGSLAKGRAPAPEHALDQLARIRKEMEAIGNLDSIGRTLTRPVGVRTGTIAADDVDAGVL